MSSTRPRLWPLYLLGGRRRPGAPDGSGCPKPPIASNRSCAAWPPSFSRFSLLCSGCSSRRGWPGDGVFAISAVPSSSLRLVLDCFRIEGMSGDFAPILEWRWSTKDEARRCRRRGRHRARRPRLAAISRPRAQQPPPRRPPRARLDQAPAARNLASLRRRSLVLVCHCRRPGRNPGATRLRGAGRLLRPGNGPQALATRRFDSLRGPP